MLSWHGLHFAVAPNEACALSQELAATSVHLAEAVSAAGARVTASLGTKSEEIKLALLLTLANNAGLQLTLEETADSSEA